jgi:hypothetical protein
MEHSVQQMTDICADGNTLTIGRGATAAAN